MNVQWPSQPVAWTACPVARGGEPVLAEVQPVDTLTIGDAPACASVAGPVSAPSSMPVAAASVGGPVGQALASESERLAEFFRVGGGSTEGLRAPDLAGDLLAARQAGATFVGGGRDPESVSPEQAYDMMLSPYGGSVYLGIDGVQMVACRRDTLRSGLDAFAPLSEAHREVLRHGRLDYYALQCALDRIAGQRTPQAIHAHSELLVALYDRVKASGRHAGSSEDAAHAMTRVYDWLSPRLAEMAQERVGDVLAWTARAGSDEACKAAEHALSLDASAYAEFAAVMGAIGNADASKHALAAAGGDRERLGALKSMCAEYASSPHGEEALSAFQAVLEARPPGESPGATADRYVALHRALAARSLEGRALECFRELEARWQKSGDTSPGRTYMTFLDHVHRTGRTDGALLPPPPATVDRGANAVVVAGVRIPVRGPLAAP